MTKGHHIFFENINNLFTNYTWLFLILNCHFASGLTSSQWVHSWTWFQLISHLDGVTCYRGGSILRYVAPNHKQIDFKCSKIRKHNHDFAALFCLRHKNNYNPSGGYSKVVSLAKHSISCCQVLDPWSLKKNRNPVWPVSVRRASLLHRWSSVGQGWIIQIQFGTPDICITWALPKDCNTGNRESLKTAYLQ